MFIIFLKMLNGEINFLTCQNDELSRILKVYFKVQTGFQILNKNFIMQAKILENGQITLKLYFITPLPALMFGSIVQFANKSP